MAVHLDRIVEERLVKLVTALSEAFTPDADKVRAALKDIVNFHPEQTPIQFTDPDCHPMYSAADIKKRADVRQEIKDDAQAPFISESYLYTLLGKEDARTLLARFRRLFVALGVDEETLYPE
jgi:hypothetical protein